MKRILAVTAAFALMGIAFAFPPDLRAEDDTNCQIKATKPVYLEARYLQGHRKSPSIRHKGDIIWSGNLRRGGVVSVTATSGMVHLVYMDLTQEDPRTENKKRTCQSGNVILIPR